MKGKWVLILILRSKLKKPFFLIKLKNQTTQFQSSVITWWTKLYFKLHFKLYFKPNSIWHLPAQNVMTSFWCLYCQLWTDLVHIILKYCISIDNERNFEKLLLTILVIYFQFSQPATTCSKLTIEILEQGVKYVQS